jgi:hypothetical protein
MIVSPRAKPVTDIVRIENRERIIEIDEVFLLRRANKDSPYQKIPYWKRGEDNMNVGSGSCCCNGTSKPGDCDHKPCVILAEADYDTQTSTFDHTARVLGGNILPTGDTIEFDHIIEKDE